MKKKSELLRMKKSLRNSTLMYLAPGFQNKTNHEKGDPLPKPDVSC
jgi:hypothetical protein